MVLLSFFFNGEAKSIAAQCISRVAGEISQIKKRYIWWLGGQNPASREFHITGIRWFQNGTLRRLFTRAHSQNPRISKRRNPPVSKSAICGVVHLVTFPESGNFKAGGSPGCSSGHIRGIRAFHISQIGRNQMTVIRSLSNWIHTRNVRISKVRNPHVSYPRIAGVVHLDTFAESANLKSAECAVCPSGYIREIRDYQITQFAWYQGSRIPRRLPVVKLRKFRTYERNH